ncbi:MAG: methylated-DNA--[protein]-cysteine S-methyltransferase [Candidatus Aminicenantes bacterium]|nr:methylated-DNA--[protein]-cysteine S-methyltransferase [Candidatus Aminicenantes bacterium]
MTKRTGAGKTYYQSEIGFLEILGTEAGISYINFVDEEKVKEDPAEIPALLAEGVRQLDEYFKGKRKEFSLKLRPGGTDFQQRAWQELQRIPYGETISYGQQAERMGNIKACRAVGGANGRNPISVVIPCHRVIGKDGSLTGFGSGTWRKEWLLNHERKFK